MDPRKHFSALNIIHRIIEEKVQPGDLCIDATAGGTTHCSLRSWWGKAVMSPLSISSRTPWTAPVHFWRSTECPAGQMFC